MKLTMLLFVISFMLGCTDQGAFLIRVEQDGVFVGNKKVANTADVAKQDSFLVEVLHKALESKKDTSKNCQIKIEPEQSLNVLYKVATTCYVSGYTNTSIVSRINGEDYTQPFSSNNIDDIKCNPYKGEEIIPPYYDDCLRLWVSIGIIDEDSLEIGIKGGSLLKIFYKENPDSAYDELASQLVKLYNHPVNDGPDRDVVRIFFEENTKISNIIPVMHRLRTTGFTEINLRLYKAEENRKPWPVPH
jgi:hypothetical protein